MANPEIDNYVPTLTEVAPTHVLRDIGWAVMQLREGNRVRRAGWNGRGMYLYLVPASNFQVSRPPLLGILREGAWVSYQAHVDMSTANGTIVPWLCSQTDLLATDWEIAV